MTCAVFMGSKALGLAVLKSADLAEHPVSCVILCDDSADRRSNKAEFIVYCERRHIDCRVVRSPAEAKAALAILRPDIVLVSGWYWLLDAETTELPPLGVWGLHNSLLPKYRGFSPLVWAMINGEEKVGASLFRIGRGMDDGAVAHKFEVHVEEDAGIGDVLVLLEQKVRMEMGAVWRGLLDGTWTTCAQVAAEASFGGLRTQEDGRIDWTQDCRRVHDFVRAQAPPYPCAYAHLDGAKIRIARTRRCADLWHGTPGQVLLMDDDAVLIACGRHSALYVAQVLDAAGDVAPARSVIRSLKSRLT